MKAQLLVDLATNHRAFCKRCHGEESHHNNSPSALCFIKTWSCEDRDTTLAPQINPCNVFSLFQFMSFTTTHDIQLHTQYIIPGDSSFIVPRMHGTAVLWFALKLLTHRLEMSPFMLIVARSLNKHSLAQWQASLWHTWEVNTSLKRRGIIKLDKKLIMNALPTSVYCRLLRICG